MKRKLFCQLLSFFVVSPFLLWAQQDNEPQDFVFKDVIPRNYNGSSYTIYGEDLKNLPVTDLSNLLTGLVPGYFSYQTSGGTVDESSSYWIRGRRTNSEGVLVLVDGQEREFGVLSSHEIESITVLKDALFSALYGTRAANGVILVNTKEGVQGKTRVELTMQLINQQPIGLLKPLDALGYAEHYNQALMYDGVDASNMYSQYYLNQYRDRAGVNPELYPDVDWLGEYYKNSSWVQRYNVSITGGTNRTKFFINGGFLSQNGMYNTDREFSYSTNNNTDRYNLRSNFQVDVTPTTLLNLDLYGWYDKQNRPGRNSVEVYNTIMTTPANAFPSYYQDSGEYLDQDGNQIQGIENKLTAGDGINSNPWALLNRNGYSISHSVYGSFRAQLTQELPFITKGLKASFALSMDSYTGALTLRQKPYAYYQFADINDPTVLRRTNNDSRMSNSVDNRASQGKTSLDFQLSYNKQVDEHTFSALAFYNQYEHTNQVSIPSRFQTVGTWINYDYDQRYSIDLIGSYHGVYKFAPGKRFGFFPAAAVGWTVSNESFFEPLKDHVSLLKLRASYGVIGNQRGISEFYFMGRLNPTSNIYNVGNNMRNLNGYVEDIIPNPNLTWETVEQLNFGLNLTLLDNRLNLGVDYFNDKRSDMYMQNSRVTSILGTEATIQENIGEMYSNGYEAALSWNAKAGELHYHVGATYSLFENEMKKTGEVDEAYPWLLTAGHPLGIRRGYKAVGLFQSYEEIAAAPAQTFSDVHPGDIRYEDINKDGIIDRNDFVPLDYANVPRLFYGINAGISYKGIGLRMLFQGTGYVTTYLDGKVAYPFYSNGTIYEHQLDYWTPENSSNSMPGISRLHSNVNNSQNSSFWIRDASYLRLKNVELSYLLPDNMLNDKYVNQIRFFVNGYNLYVWTKEKLPIDPEDNGDSSSMPLTRNISFGLSVKF